MSIAPLRPTFTSGPGGSIDPALVPAALVKGFDRDKDGALGRDELDIKAFARLDRDGNGKLTVDEVQAALKGLPHGKRELLDQRVDELANAGATAKRMYVLAGLQAYAALGCTAFCFFTLGWPLALGALAFLGLGSFLLFKEGLRHGGAAKAAPGLVREQLDSLF